MKKFKVPFKARELVVNNCVTTVEAENEEEAIQKVAFSIENSNPFADFDCDWDGFNSITEEVIETEEYYLDDPVLEEIKEVEEPFCELEYEAFDLLRLEKDAVYGAVEQKLGDIEVFDMKMIPVRLNGISVVYKCIPTEYSNK
jgi:hypothetical protein